jgi:hypothetical protein
MKPVVISNAVTQECNIKSILKGLRYAMKTVIEL